MQSGLTVGLWSAHRHTAFGCNIRLYFPDSPDCIFLTLLMFLTECGMNVHHKCQKKVANLCGINQKLLAEALNQVSQVCFIAICQVSSCFASISGVSLHLFCITSVGNWVWNGGNTDSFVFNLAHKETKMSLTWSWIWWRGKLPLNKRSFKKLGSFLKSNSVLL